MIPEKTIIQNQKMTQKQKFKENMQFFDLLFHKTC